MEKDNCTKGAEMAIGGCCGLIVFFTIVPIIVAIIFIIFLNFC